MEQPKKTSVGKTEDIDIYFSLVRELCFAKYFSSDKENFF